MKDTVRRRRPDTEADEAPLSAYETAVPAPPAAEPAPRREPTDFEGLRSIAEMDRSEIDTLLAEFAPRKGSGQLRRGQRVRGHVTRVTASTVFVDVGEKADATVERIELDAEVTPGSVFDGFVAEIRDGEVRISRSIGGEGSGDMLDTARHERMPVSGRVIGHNEHGLEVQLAGGVRAFCPASQVEALGAETVLAEWMGRSATFRVIDVRGSDAVVSRRAIVEEEAQAEQARVLEGVREGDVFEGTVVRITEFGAFVRLANGLEGLVHISNLADRRVTRAEDVVQQGQVVKVRVLAVDVARRRLNLGMKQASDSVAPTESRQEGTFGTLGSLLGGVKVGR